jgi:hypothetical protein
MGGRFSRNRNLRENDPFYNDVPPVDPNRLSENFPGTAYDPTGGFDVYDPYYEYGHGGEFEATASMTNYYGRRGRLQPNNYGGRYAQGKHARM